MRYQLRVAGSAPSLMDWSTLSSENCHSQPSPSEIGAHSPNCKCGHHKSPNPSTDHQKSQTSWWHHQDLNIYRELYFPIQHNQKILERKRIILKIFNSWVQCEFFVIISECKSDVTEEYVFASACVSLPLFRWTWPWTTCGGGGGGQAGVPRQQALDSFTLQTSASQQVTIIQEGRYNILKTN